MVKYDEVRQNAGFIVHGLSIEKSVHFDLDKSCEKVEDLK